MSSYNLSFIQPNLDITVDNPVVRETVPIPAVVDDALSTTSENPVQNKVITNALASKANTESIPNKVSQLQNDSGYLTEAPVSSVNGQTGAVNLSIPSTASDVGAVATNQGQENAGKFLVVGSNGVVDLVTIPNASSESF